MLTTKFWDVKTRKHEKKILNVFKNSAAYAFRYGFIRKEIQCVPVKG
jgi:hypothetical protein